MSNTKQVIVVRKFPNLRTGKYCSQVAHASMAFLTKGMNIELRDHNSAYFTSQSFNADYRWEISHWLNNSFRKICVYVNSEEELDNIHQKALDNGLISHMITDNGATEFNGVPTKTCVAIGPHWDNRFEGITDKLPLL